MQQFNPKQYLAIDIANHFGLDKETYETRIQWVKEHYNELENLQPLADEPVLYMKAIKALRDTDKGLPTGHTVALDSVNSGLQIMSALMRDKNGCKLTGLIDTGFRPDSYESITNAINKLLKDDGIDEINITRKQAKEACMTWAYGSQKVPMRVFNEYIDYFYKAIETEFKGANELMGILLNSWQPYEIRHEWLLPDNHLAYCPVMQKVKERYKVSELNYNATITYMVNEGSEYDLSNAANVIHSIDAYILRTMVRYCNYNKGVINAFIHKVNTAKYKDVQTNEIITRWKETNIADISFINYIDDVSVYPVELINQLYNKCLMLLQYQPFEIITIHDSFACHANHCQRMRYYYNVILAELSDSTCIDDICSQIYGYRGSIDKGKSIREYILNSDYAIC